MSWIRIRHALAALAASLLPAVVVFAQQSGETATSDAKVIGLSTANQSTGIIHGARIGKQCQRPRCVGESLDCTVFIGHADSYGDSINIQRAWDVVDPADKSTRVPESGDLPIMDVFGNTTCVVGGALPCLICGGGRTCGGAPPVSDQPGAVFFHQSLYVIQPDDPSPLVDQANLLVQDLCDAEETQSCSAVASTLQFTAATETSICCEPPDGHPSTDCNGNGITDWCEIADGANSDCDANGLPDECDRATIGDVREVMEDFEDGNWTPPWNLVGSSCPGAAIVDDPLRPNNLVYMAAGTNTASCWLVAEPLIPWERYVTSFEYTMLEYSTTDPSGDLFHASLSLLGACNDQADRISNHVSGRAGVDGMYITGGFAPGVMPLGQWLRIMSWYNTATCSVDWAIIRVADNAILAEGSWEALSLVAASPIQCVWVEIEETNQQFVDNISVRQMIDCNENAVPDEVDLLRGSNRDCNANASPDECDLSCGFGGQSDYVVVAAVTPPGHNNPNTSPILRYAGDGTDLPADRPDIPASFVFDPAGVAFDQYGELFVGNRHGNAGPGSISRFRFDGCGAWRFNGQIIGNGLEAVHQVSFSPTSGELFAPNYWVGTVSRFTFDPNRNAVPNGVIAVGTPIIIGLAVSPAGEVFVGAADGIHRFQIDDNGVATANGSIPIVTGGFLYFDAQGRLLFGSNESILRCTFDAGGAASCEDVNINVANGVMGIVITPSDELLVTTHGSGGISRFLDHEGQWDSGGFIPTPSLGGIAVLALDSIRSHDCNMNGRPDECEPTATADFDGNHGVDVSDLAHFVDCMLGPDQTAGYGSCPRFCAHIFDLEGGDQDVDLADFAQMTERFTGGG